MMFTEQPDLVYSFVKSVDTGLEFRPVRNPLRVGFLQGDDEVPLDPAIGADPRFRALVDNASGVELRARQHEGPID
jgi:hypothetical protein